MSSPERLDYCISKAGLAAFSQGLALRLAETGISVFEVRPGIIRTDMTAGVSEIRRADRWRAGTDETLGRGGRYRPHLRRIGIRQFGFATGSVINADGGLSIARL
jgi:3-oxoacyl-[acyl-carrier protein] reductase